MKRFSEMLVTILLLLFSNMTSLTRKFLDVAFASDVTSKYRLLLPERLFLSSLFNIMLQ